MSAYGYCYNNPVNLVDPTGMAGEDPIDPPKPGQGTNSGSMEGENHDGSPNGKVATIILDNITLTYQRQSKKSTSSMDGYFKPAYDTHKPNPFSPSTDWRYSVAIVGVVAIPVLIEAFGAAAISEFVIEEAAENVAENLAKELTGVDVPIVVNPIDIVEYGVKKGTKEAFKSFGDIVTNPKSLWGKSADEVGIMLGDGWTRGTYGSKKTGWKFIKGDE